MIYVLAVIDKNQSYFHLVKINYLNYNAYLQAKRPAMSDIIS